MANGATLAAGVMPALDGFLNAQESRAVLTYLSVRAALTAGGAADARAIHGDDALALERAMAKLRAARSLSDALGIGPD